MPVVSFLTNTSSIAAQRQLDRASDSLSRTFERLSSGQRINRPSDDAAGEAIATGLNVRARVYTQGYRNANDAISALNIAQGATSELTGVLIRVKELATSAANGTYGLAQRRSLDTEADQLVREFNRIVTSTQFNGLKLVDGQLGEISAQLGFGINERIGFSVGAGLSKKLGNGSYSGGSVLSGSISNSSYGTTADFNGDGKLDLLTNSSLANTANIQFGDGNGGFSSSISLTFTGGFGLIGEVQVGDFNGDGRPDVVGAKGSNGLQIFMNQGGGSFTGPTTLGSATQGIAIADLNGDGKLDLATGSGSNVLVYYGTGTGSFSAASTFIGSVTVASLAVGDFDGDGRVDLLAKDGSGTTGLFHDNSNGTLAQTAISSISGGTGYMAVSDFNHDGILDLAAAGTNSVKVTLGIGDGRFGSTTSYSITGANTGQPLYLTDFNSDGASDLVISSTSSGEGTINVLLNNGNGTFDTSTSFLEGFSDVLAGFAIPGDFNGDGVPDIYTSDIDDIGAGRFFLQNTINSTTIGRFDLTTRAGALDALSSVDAIMQRLTKELGNIGASQSRLFSAINTLGTQRDNYLAASGRIKDADISTESSQMIRYQILREAASAVLAQANQNPQIGLTLLRG